MVAAMNCMFCNSMPHTVQLDYTLASHAPAAQPQIVISLGITFCVVLHTLGCMINTVQVVKC